MYILMWGTDFNSFALTGKKSDVHGKNPRSSMPLDASSSPLSTSKVKYTFFHVLSPTFQAPGNVE